MGNDKILVVEDEPEIRDLLVHYLHKDGYHVLTASSGSEALEKARQGVALVILDIMIPRPDGLDVTRILRSSSAVPILILSARGEEADRVAGLELGADDYMTKPFRPRELLARVKALLRRSAMPAFTSVESGPLAIDLDNRTVRLEGELLELTPTEYELLRTLAGAPGKNFTREELLDRVWGVEYVGDLRRVDNYVSRLRQKLKREDGPDLIRSIWGVGYRMEL
ncbi:MAG: response regulator transcription factor [Vulcanimicrobiota bacterium]